MKEEQDESKARKYFRNIMLCLSMILFLVVIVSAIMRKFGS